MLPVAPHRVTLANTRMRGGRAPVPGSASRARDDQDAALAVARQHVGRRMAEAVAVAGLEHRNARMDRIEECRGRGGAAAVVRRDQDIALQALADGCDELRLLVA